MSELITKEELLARAGRKTEVVDIADLGTVEVGELTSGDFVAIASIESDPERVLKTVELGLTKPILSPDEVRSLKLSALFEIAQAVNGLNQIDLKAEEGSFRHESP